MKTKHLSITCALAMALDHTSFAADTLDGIDVLNPNISGATVSVEVSYDSATRIFEYRYTVQNPASSTGGIDEFHVNLISTAAPAGAAPPHGPRFRTDAHDASLRLVPVGIDSPDFWESALMWAGRAQWFVQRIEWASYIYGKSDPAEPPPNYLVIGPGESATGFVLRSPNPPGPRGFLLYPAFGGDHRTAWTTREGLRVYGVTTGPVDNSAPIADAGPNQFVECDRRMAAQVTLDGSGSTDPNGAPPLTFSWFGPFGIVSGVNPTVIVPLGSNGVLLTASDGSASDDDSVSINVLDRTPPAITCPAPIVTECTGAGSAFFDPPPATATDICTDIAGVTDPVGRVFNLGSTTVFYSARDSARSNCDGPEFCVGNFSSCSTTVTVADRIGPSIVCPPPVSVECTGPEGAVVDPGTASASEACTVVTQLTSPGPSTFAVGTHAVQFFAADAAGNQSACSTAVTVTSGPACAGGGVCMPDVEAPAVSVGSGPELWPPNHHYRRVSLADCGVTIADACDGSLELVAASAAITCVTSDEPEDVNGQGDGHTAADIVIVDAMTVDVRAERQGASDGRVYQIHFAVSDAAGNVAPGVCVVSVPHDQGGHPIAVDSGDAYSVCR